MIDRALIINNGYHSFNPFIAGDVGMGAATVYNFIKGWCRHNALNGKHYNEGLYWTYNTYEALQNEFFYLSLRSIKTYIKVLADNGYIAIGHFNKKGYDNTNWYADLFLADKDGAEFAPPNDEDTEIAQWQCKNCTPLEKENGVSENQQTSVFRDMNTDESLENTHSANLARPIPINLTNNNKPNINTNSTVSNSTTNTNGLKEKIVGKPTKKESPVVEDVYYPNNAELDEAFKEYIAYRNEGKHKISARGIKMAMTELKKLAGSDDDYAIAIIHQSIIADYRGLFPLKGYKPVDAAEKQRKEFERLYDYYIQEEQQNKEGE